MWHLKRQSFVRQLWVMLSRLNMHYTAALELARKLIYYSQCFFLEKKMLVHVTEITCLKFVFTKFACSMKNVPVHCTDVYRHKSTDYSYDFLPQCMTCEYVLVLTDSCCHARLKLSKNWQKHHSLSIWATRKSPSVKSQVLRAKSQLSTSQSQCLK